MCASQDVHVTAYSPLGTPDSKDMMKREETPSLTEEQTVVEVAKAHDKHPVQVRRGPEAVPMVQRLGLRLGLDSWLGQWT